MNVNVTTHRNSNEKLNNRRSMGRSEWKRMQLLIQREGQFVAFGKGSFAIVVCFHCNYIAAVDAGGAS